MIKLLHLADIHLGMENYGRTDPKTGLNSRLLDFLESFDYAVDYALKNDIDLVLFAGDAFKSRYPSPTYQREFAKRIKKLASSGIPTVLLVGNHDIPASEGKANTLDIYHTLEVENVYVSRKPELLTLDLKNKEKIQIATLPWLAKSILASKKDYEKKTISEIHQEMAEKLVKKVKDLIPQIDDHLPCVMLAHTTIAGAEYGSEHKVYVGSDVVLPLNIFTQESFDYVALGHLHKFQILNQNPPVVYSGSIDRVDFSEEKEDKGFIVVEISNKNTKYQFIPVPARKFLTIRVKVNEEDSEPTQKVISQIEKNKIEDRVIRIIIEVPESQVEKLYDHEIRKVLSQAHFIAAINKEVIKKERDKKVLYTEELSVIEALERYWQSKGISQKRMERLKDYAEKLTKE